MKQNFILKAKSSKFRPLPKPVSGGLDSAPQCCRLSVSGSHYITVGNMSGSLEDDFTCSLMQSSLCRKKHFTIKSFTTKWCKRFTNHAILGVKNQTACVLKHVNVTRFAPTHT